LPVVGWPFLPVELRFRRSVTPAAPLFSPNLSYGHDYLLRAFEKYLRGKDDSLQVRILFEFRLRRSFEVSLRNCNWINSVTSFMLNDDPDRHRVLESLGLKCFMSPIL
jgi:hypothetical protein